MKRLIMVLVMFSLNAGQQGPVKVTAQTVDSDKAGALVTTFKDSARQAKKDVTERLTLFHKGILRSPHSRPNASALTVSQLILNS